MSVVFPLQNREIETLMFHQRVLAQASDERLPILARLMFLSIFASNLDEFFEIRVAGLMQKVAQGDDEIGACGMRPSETLAQLYPMIHKAVRAQYRLLNESILPRLAQEGIVYLRRDELSARQKAWVRAYFFDKVLPVLTPISIDPAHPFPRLVNKSLNFIVTLDGKDAFGRHMRFAVVPAPRSLPRVVRLPSALSDQEAHIMLSAIIHEHVGELFLGMEVTGCHQFRLTRNADLSIDDDMDDLSKAVQKKLDKRRFGQKVRLEVTHNCPSIITDFLLEEFKLTPNELYRVKGPVNLTRLITDHHADLHFAPFTPFVPRVFARGDIFAHILQKDRLLHHPFHAFTPVIDFLQQAATDSRVLAIKQTLYRSGADSEIVKALALAARNGKEVTAVIELRARFDEASNLAVASLLQKAGAVVVYGVVGYKTHAKMALVVRKEGDTLRRYVHLGTGNYHAQNAKMYTDYSLFSARVDVCQDVHNVFVQLTGMGQPAKMKHLLHAPFTLHQGLIDLIKKESALKEQGRIIFKVNSITEPAIIKALYEASSAGVRIDLIVRGACMLRPDVPGLSQNIRVRSIVGRFLEHSRVYYFGAGQANGAGKLYCASSDLMERNLLHRIEIAFPILDDTLKMRVYQDGLINYLKDTKNAWELTQTGWVRLLGVQGADFISMVPIGEDAPLKDPPSEVFDAQQYLLTHLSRMSVL